MTALTPGTSDALRLSYIDRFIDTSAEHYKNTIRKTTMFIAQPDRHFGASGRPSAEGKTRYLYDVGYPFV